MAKPKLKKSKVVDTTFNPQVEIAQIFAWSKEVAIVIYQLREDINKLETTKIIINAQLEVMVEELTEVKNEISNLRSSKRTLKGLDTV